MRPTFRFIFDPIRFHLLSSLCLFTQSALLVPTRVPWGSFSCNLAPSFSCTRRAESSVLGAAPAAQGGFCLNGPCNSRRLQHRFDEPAIQTALLMSQQITLVLKLLPSCIDWTGCRDLAASMYPSVLAECLPRTCSEKRGQTNPAYLI